LSTRARGEEIDPEHELDRQFAAHLERLWQRYTNRLLSEVSTIQQRGLVEILESVIWERHDSEEDVLPDVDIAYQSVRDFLHRQGVRMRGRAAFENRYKSVPYIKQLVRKIDRIEGRILDAEQPRRALEDLIKEFFSEGKEIRFKHSDIAVRANGDEISLAALSSGEKQLLRIMVETAMAEEDTIIIDEPELSMHIDWQRQLVGALRTINPRAQIIMATHSPEVMADIPDEKIFAL